MILAIGLGLLGFVALRRAHRRCHAYGGDGCGYGYGDGWYGGPWGPMGHHHTRKRWMLHAVLRRLDATPAQERVIVGELDTLVGRVHATKASLGDARGDLAAAIRGTELDDAALGAALGRFDAATGEARAAAIDALRAIHAVLDEKQRAQLADLVDRSGGWWRRGPYR